MEDIIKRLKEKNKKKLEFIEQNSDVLGKEIVQSKSEVKLFNTIGNFATDKGYNSVYFKTKTIGIHEDNFRTVDVHYIHIYDGSKLNVSIYYDKDRSILSNLNIPYYEMYDGSKTKRFFANEEEEVTLLNETIIRL